MMGAADTFIIWRLIPIIRDADSANVCSTSVWTVCAGSGLSERLLWWRMTILAGGGFGFATAGRKFLALSRWELICSESIHCQGVKVGGQHFRTIWLKPDDERVVELIDQRFLPYRFVIEDVRTVEQMATAIRDMHVRGAGLIGASAGYGMYLAAIDGASGGSFDEHMTRAAAQLKATRPTAVNLSWAIERQLKSIAEGKPGEKVALALRTAKLIADEDAEHCRM